MTPPDALARLRMPTDTAPPRGTGRGWLLLAAVAYTVFVVYGSLVPLDYRPLPWAQALESMRAIRYLELGIASRADWVANILLFVPLGFLWAGVSWPARRTAWRVVVAAAVLLVACALSVCIEFVQLYFPQRTVSLNDIIAESIGALAGIAAWWTLGPGTLRWLQGLALVRGTANTAQRLLVVYLVVLFGYSLMPLDLTISPVELYKKWREGKVIWLPFTTTYADSAQRAYDLITDVALWVPAAALWRLAFGKTARHTWWSAVAAAGMLELMQLFVYSRVTDVTDVLTAGIGAALGVWLVRGRGTAPPLPAAPGRGALRWALAAVVWMGVLAVVFWYPFDFHVNRQFLNERLAGLQRVPFEAYYFGSEFRAITEVLRKSLFMAPLGFLLYRFGDRLPPSWPRGAVHVAMLTVIVGTAATIETGQLLLPTKNADVTDWALECLGGALGYFGSLFVAQRLGAPDVPLAMRRG